MRRLVYGVLPGLILVLAIAAGWVKWHDGSVRAEELLRDETVSAATESTIRMLSFGPDTVEHDLSDAQQLMTDGFRDGFAVRARDQIIPDAKARKITATAEVPGAAAVWATPKRAAVLVFVDRTVTLGSDEPGEVESSYRVTLDKVDGRWLVADFEPV
jgi:Mce-associated membrane protein